MSESECTEKVSEEVRRLRAQVFQLKNIIKKLTGQETAEGEVGAAADEESGNRERGRNKRKKERKFDFTLYKKRHVLFKVRKC